MENFSNVLNENGNDLRDKTDKSTDTDGSSSQSDNNLQGRFPNDGDFLCPTSKTGSEEKHQEIEMKELTVSKSSPPSASTQISDVAAAAVVPRSSFSNTSADSICRICQLAAQETGENLKLSECDCRGHMAKVHVSCLHQWVRYRGTNRCEICRANFAGVTPPNTPGILEREAMAALTWQLERTRPFNRRKRAAMAAVVVFLVIVTCVTSLLTVSADREYQRVSRAPWSSKKDLEDSNIVFSICIAFTFFCGTMTIGLLVIWFGMECCFQIHRRAILRAAATRLVQNDNAA